MRTSRAAVLLALLLTSACGRTTQSLLEYRDEHYGFQIRYPAGWAQVRSPEGGIIRFVPPDRASAAEESAEFILVSTEAASGKLSDTEMRRQVFTLLSVQGVSGFQQDARATSEVLWYKFEVTGASGSTEWASVGVVVSGPAKYHVVVCAKPLNQWRQGQKQCDEVIKTFLPGNLQR